MGAMNGCFGLMGVPLVLGEAGIVFAFENSTVASKLIIFVLLVASIFSWSVMWTKYVFIRAARRENGRFMAAFRRARKPLALYRERERFEPSPLAAVYQSGARELSFHLLGSSEVDETYEARLASAEPLGESSHASIRTAMEREVGVQMLKLESQVILLATAVSGAPFLGLLGTVWGVMDAFSGVATEGSGSLSAIAPGVSGSLLTTVVALCVAIPAMFGYNFLVTTIRSMTVEMENFAAECAASFEHQYSQKLKS